MESKNALKVREIIRLLEDWAPPVLQESYDNSGLIVGDRNAEITKVLVSLDCTEEVVAEAEAVGAGLIVSHHPIVFGGLKSLTGATYVERTVIRAIRSGIAIYAIHTNLDNVFSGVNYELATALGCEPNSLKILRPKPDLLTSIVVFCPKENAESIKEAMHEAGAGAIGDYDMCSFSSEGEGAFRPDENADPFIGSSGEVSRVDETRIEVLCERSQAGNVISAAKRAHPYEEMAHFVTNISNKDKSIGSGMIGKLKDSITWECFLDATKTALQATHIKHTSPVGKMVKTIAVCGGSGSFLLRDAISKGADVFVTSDFKYHEFFDADNKIMIADVGHYESEWRTSTIIANRVREKFTNFAVHLASANTNPVQIR
jgi:dinuclear metal center YbgI/SA1388 family protein